jgi:hypothetical protein
VQREYPVPRHRQAHIRALRRVGELWEQLVVELQLRQRARELWVHLEELQVHQRARERRLALQQVHQRAGERQLALQQVQEPQELRQEVVLLERHPEGEQLAGP